MNIFFITKAKILVLSKLSYKSFTYADYIEPRMVTIFGARILISFRHMFIVCYPLLNSYQTTQHSNVGE